MIRSAAGSASRTAPCARACASWQNDTPPYELDGRRIGEATFELPADLPIGYHRLHVDAGGVDAVATLIVSPDAAALPAALGGGRTGAWPPSSTASAPRRSWGIGDLTDLTDLAVWSAARYGAGFILVNPLHAAAPAAPMEPSPYLPTSRRFVNPIYLRVEAIPEFAYVARPRRAAQGASAARRPGRRSPS